MREVPSSELLINDDGSIFHLHLHPEQIADTIVLVGDPGRVDLIASKFDSTEFRLESREFRSVTGSYKGCRMTALSTGIGIGNIDICMTELDALANIDLHSRTVKGDFRQLTILRLGTSGALQDDIKIGDFIFAKSSLGFDGLLNYYAGCNDVCDMDLKRAFVEQVRWNAEFPNVYAVDADSELFELFKGCTREGITIASSGFYAPQGRYVRIAPAELDLNSRIERFEYQGRKITNYEMESSVLAGLAKMMGHRAATICTVIAQRVKEDACTDYKPFVEKMIVMALDKLAEDHQRSR